MALPRIREGVRRSIPGRDIFRPPSGPENDSQRPLVPAMFYFPHSGLETMGRPAVLADLAKENVGIMCQCNGCRHHASVPIGFVVKLFGRKYPVPMVARRLRCSKCGSRDVTTTPDWPSNWPPIPGNI